jgi:hypothetical protein
MKKFISTKLFLSLEEVSQKGIDADVKVLENGYDKFSMLLFSEDAACRDKAAYRNVLVYTCGEVRSLTEVPGEKCSNLSSENYLHN